MTLRYQRRLTGRAWALIVSGIGLLLLATHSGSNAVVLLAFLCVSLPVAAAGTHWFALRGLEMSPVSSRVIAAHSDVQCQFTVLGEVSGAVLALETPVGRAENRAGRTNQLALPAQHLARGIYSLTDSRFVAEDPLGLFRVSRPLSARECPEGTALSVFPAPDWVHPIRPNTTGTAGLRKTVKGEAAGLRLYRQGDEPSAVNWRASARSDALVVNEYEIASDEGTVMFELPQVSPNHLEAALSSLSSGILEAVRNGASAGLVLPGHRIDPGRGQRHIDGLLKALAGYDPASRPLTAQPVKQGA